MNCTCEQLYFRQPDDFAYRVDQNCPTHGAPKKFTKLDRHYDTDGNLVALMCCICFEWVDLADVYVDANNIKWDMCHTCGKLEDWLADQNRNGRTNQELLQEYFATHGG